MFTGIVEAIGEIRDITPTGKGARLSVAAGKLDLSDIKTGDSIAVNGLCLTVAALAPGGFVVELSEETLNCAAGFREHTRVNLEKALKLSDRLGGHLVSGHVDGVGNVVRFEPAGECVWLAVRAAQGLEKYIARKGSITIDGVSLTVNEVDGVEFSVNLIPYTLEATNLKYLKTQAKVNLEVDMIARYLERLHSLQEAPGAKP